MPKSSSASPAPAPRSHFEHLRRLLRILHHQALGDLEPQRALRHDGAAEDVAHLLDQLRAEQLPARDVDADEQRPLRARQLRLPARRLVRRAQQDVRAELDDQVGLLGDRHELGAGS